MFMFSAKSTVGFTPQTATNCITSTVRSCTSNHCRLTHSIQKAAFMLKSKDSLEIDSKKQYHVVWNKLKSKQSDEDGEDDDGWGESSTSSDKEKELESLRSQLSSKSEYKNRISPSSSSSSSSSQGGDTNERDLFIPIFAVVSLLGLFGAYGYEILRLYSRGELYLPGM